MRPALPPQTPRDRFRRYISMLINPGRQCRAVTSIIPRHPTDSRPSRPHSAEMGLQRWVNPTGRRRGGGSGNSSRGPACCGSGCRDGRAGLIRPRQEHLIAYPSPQAATLMRLRRPGAPPARAGVVYRRARAAWILPVPGRWAWTGRHLLEPSAGSPTVSWRHSGQGLRPAEISLLGATPCP